MKGQHHNVLMKEAHNRAGEAIFQQRQVFDLLFLFVLFAEGLDRLC